MKDREKHSLNRREFHFLRNVGQLPLAWARGHTFIRHNANCSSSALPDANENRGKSVTFGSRGRKREMGSSHLIFAKIVWIIRAHVQFFLTFALLRIYTWTGVCVCMYVAVVAIRRWNSRGTSGGLSKRKPRIKVGQVSFTDNRL